MATVERRHREAAFRCYWGTAPRPGKVTAQWVETGEGKPSNAGTAILRIAEALAEAEERGAARAVEPFAKLAEWMSGTGDAIDYTHSLGGHWTVDCVNARRWPEALAEGADPAEAARNLCVKLGLVDGKRAPLRKTRAPEPKAERKAG